MRTRGELVALYFKDIDELTPEDKDLLQPLLVKGFTPLCDWHHPGKRISMQEHVEKLTKLILGSP